MSGQATNASKTWDALPTEQLRALATKTDGGHASWSQWTREMLLAFFRNRHGQYVPEDSTP
jgi:hypothetical protein